MTAECQCKCKKICLLVAILTIAAGGCKNVHSKKHLVMGAIAYFIAFLSWSPLLHATNLSGQWLLEGEEMHWSEQDKWIEYDYDGSIIDISYEVVDEPGRGHFETEGSAVQSNGKIEAHLTGKRICGEELQLNITGSISNDNQVTFTFIFPAGSERCSRDGSSWYFENTEAVASYDGVYDPVKRIITGTFETYQAQIYTECWEYDPWDHYSVESTDIVTSGTFTVTIIGVKFLDKEDPSREVIGAVADGRSRVIVEIPDVESSANVTIPDGDGTWVSNATLQNGVWRRTWQAPESYGGSTDDNTQGKRPIDFAIVADGQSLAPPPFNLYKAPVVLLHGLWAADPTKPPVWTGLKAYLKSNGFNVVNDDPYLDDYSFEQNYYVVHAHVDRALAEARQQDLVAKKADVVGHSMGGILAKKYGDSSYIRRVVTVGTPHFGSPLANWLLEHPLLEGVLNVWGGKSMNRGAISDLQTGVCNVPGDSLDVPVLAIAGKSSPDVLPVGGDIFSKIFSLATLVTPGQLHTALFGRDASDWVVSETSQAGGLSVEEVPGIWHLEEPGNSTVFSEVADFLDDATISATGTAIGQSVQTQIEIDGSMTASPVSQTHLQLAETGGGITITAPTAGTMYSPGDSVHVSVVVPPDTTIVWVATPGSPAVISETPPFATDITIPQEDIGQCGIVAVALGGQDFLAMTSTVINVTTLATVTTLKVWPDSGLYLTAGEKVPFIVHGIFSDGVERNITASECGTAYNTTDSSVASIDANGVLTAKAPGYCSVVVSNGDSIQIPVLVQASLSQVGSLQVTKCIVTAGSKENSDKISFSGAMNATTDDISAASSIEVTIDSNDMVNPCVQSFPINETTFKKGKYSYSGTEDGVKKSFKYDVKTNKFTFSARNIDLSGLECPFTIEIEIGDYNATAEVNEAIVNGKKKPIPIKLMMGVKNVLRVDSYKATRGKKLSSDQLTVKGSFAVEDTDVNMAAVDFVVELAGQTFTIPAGSFKLKKGVFTCKNIELWGGEIANVSFNLNTCSFTMTIKNTTIVAEAGSADLSVEFADFSESVQIVLPANIIVGSSSYEGTWIGQFNLEYWDDTPQYLDPPGISVKCSRGFNITITLESMVVVNGIAVLTVTHANVDDPYFGCQVGGCTPDFGSTATLQVPAENISTVAGPCIMIIFPNDAVLGTANEVGEMHMSSDGRIISNSLGVTESWEAVSISGTGYETIYLPEHHRIIKKTWAFTKSAL